MTRTTTAFAAAAVAAVLAAGPMAASTGTTAALWEHSDTVAGKTVTTGALDVVELTRNWNDDSSYEIDHDWPGNLYQDLTSAVKVNLKGTSLAAVLRIDWAWAQREVQNKRWPNEDELVDIANLSRTLTIGGVASPILGGGFRAGIDSVYTEVLLARDTSQIPAEWRSRPHIVVGEGETSVNVTLRMENNLTGRSGEYAFVLDRGTLTAKLTQVLPNGETGGWNDAASVKLPRLRNNTQYTTYDVNAWPQMYSARVEGPAELKESPKPTEEPIPDESKVAGSSVEPVPALPSSPPEDVGDEGNGDDEPETPPVVGPEDPPVVDSSNPPVAEPEDPPAVESSNPPATESEVEVDVGSLDCDGFLDLYGLEAVDSSALVSSLLDRGDTVEVNRAVLDKARDCEALLVDDEPAEPENEPASAGNDDQAQPENEPARPPEDDEHNEVEGQDEDAA